MDIFLGENGTRKYLNGKEPYWEMFEDINEALKPYMSKLQITADNMLDRIKEKYNVEEKRVIDYE